MSNRLFCDQRQNLYIKVASSAGAARRELFGGKILSRDVIVPKMELLDEKTILVSRVDGVKGTKVRSGRLNDLLLDYFECQRPLVIKSMTNSIFEEVEKLSMIFGENSALSNIERKLVNFPLFPVHGDLQKQNIFVVEGKLALIDFEHFLFAPRELELVNSLFFTDGNCLDLSDLLPKLMAMGKISAEMLRDMLAFYTLKQASMGRGYSDCRKRCEMGIEKLKVILGKGVYGEVPFQLQLSAVVPSVSCRE